MLQSIGNKRVRARKETFVKLIDEHLDKTWFICSHDNPDPDSIASCCGMLHILKFLGVDDIHIVYCGEISHPQNRAMINVLQLGSIKKWKEIPNSETNGSKFIFVDCSYNQKNMSINIVPTIVIDHHKISISNKDVLFIHDEIGACSTLIFDLALSIVKCIGDDKDGIEEIQCFDPEEEGANLLATALAIGIKTDTLDFLAETTTADDFQAFRVLGRYLSNEKFGKIVNYEFPPYVLDYEQVAWQNKKSNFVPHFITGLGYIEASQADCIPTIADKFMRLQGVQTVIVYGIVECSIRASVRTSSASFDCQSLCDDVFGKGNGGSKQGLGGARVTFNIFDPSEMSEEERKSFWHLTKFQIESRFDRATTK